MADFTDTEADDTTISNASFENPIGSTWAVGQSKLYPDATWARLYTLLARTGDYGMRCSLAKSGANYRGSTWIYKIVDYPTTAIGHAYRATVYAKRWLAAGANWKLRVQVSSAGGLNEYTDYSYSTFTAAWKACTHDFTGDGESLVITVYCIAVDTNTQQYPVIIDDVALTNLTQTGSWAEDTVAAVTLTEEAAAPGAWVEDRVTTDPAYTEESAVTNTWTEVTS